MWIWIGSETKLDPKLLKNLLTYLYDEHMMKSYYEAGLYQFSVSAGLFE